MGLNTGRQPQLPSPHNLSVRLRAFRVRKGWNMDRLARAAGVSRTTVYHLERGDISQPRASTLYKLAVALEVAPQELESASATTAAAPESDRPSDAGTSEKRLIFDRATNSRIKKAYSASPAVFEDWTDHEWEELYSTFGVGGAPNEHGVLAIAGKINRKREILQKLRVILETHHAEIAAGLVENLFALVEAESESALRGLGAHTTLPAPTNQDDLENKPDDSGSSAGG